MDECFVCCVYQLDPLIVSQMQTVADTTNHCFFPWCYQPSIEEECQTNKVNTFINEQNNHNNFPYILC